MSDRSTRLTVGKPLLLLAMLAAVVTVAASHVASAANSGLDQGLVDLSVLSAKALNGTAGDFVTVNSQIKNVSNRAIDGITTYLSLVDRDNKLPVDLEDWSAEKGLYIGTIEPGQVFPLNWKIHFVKAGSYSLVVVAVITGQDKPEVSSIVVFDVKPKRNLNPGKVLPVALGEPLLVIIALLGLSLLRRTGKPT